ncbi:MAG: ABC transporter substrate-binding protein [Pirellulaceae bacterium]|jgi:multiple sugar transport system substrate-binding protein|nr:ABC transporter substrate-binding protein [Pirellulaceae bacterium]
MTRNGAVLTMALILLVCGLVIWDRLDVRAQLPPERREVVFWHFWGGADRAVVEDVVARFNRSQDEHFVRAIAMPGNNLDLKLFLAVSGGDPPDLINQDDPIMADWASRGALMPLDEVTSPDEVERLRAWLVPAARQLGSYDDRMYALCNGLDIRALYYNKTLLDEYQLAPPTNLTELDQIAVSTMKFDETGTPQRFGYLPDPRRLLAWGTVFGGDFFDEPTGRVTADSEPIVRALQWMTGFRRRYGPVAVAAFRQGDQSLPGKSFPLLAGRYTMVMDGQWRVRDIVASQNEQRRRGVAVTQYGVCPLPAPLGGREHAGWVNGNFFVVPRGAQNQHGAWQFMKYWSGFDGYESEAAQTCRAGGWIPVSTRVVRQPEFQRYLTEQPLFAQFVELAESPHQFPTPVIPGAPFFQRTINETASKAMYVEGTPPVHELLHQATRTIQAQLDANKETRIVAP